MSLKPAVAFTVGHALPPILQARVERANRLVDAYTGADGLGARRLMMDAGKAYSRKEA